MWKNEAFGFALDSQSKAQLEVALMLEKTVNHIKSTTNS